MLKRRRVVLGATVAVLVGAGAALATTSSTKPYTVGIAGGYETKALLSVGDQVPETSHKSKRYQMVGIPDGLGAYKSRKGTTVFMNHELDELHAVGAERRRTAQPRRVRLEGHPRPPREGGLRRARVRLGLQREHVRRPRSGGRKRDAAFSRFCSGSLAGPEHGFDRQIYFTNEEEGTPANSFDGKGGLTVAITDNKLFTIPKLGRFSWENSLVQPTKGKRTLIMGMEDGPATQAIASENSQLYMYVGTKERHHGASVLRRNGLDNGQLYVLAPADGVTAEETVFRNGVIAVKWHLIPNAGDLDEAQLEAASDAVNAFRFARTEDGAFNKRNPNEYLFVTTGEAPGADVLGRLWSLNLHPGNPLRPGTLEVLYNADDVIAAGGDTAISPDNIDVSDDYLMINEDGTASSRPVMAAKNRDGSIWRFDIDEGGVDVSSKLRVAELDPPGRDGVAVGPGVWETSGIIDAEDLFGDNTWLFDVQAHPPTVGPGTNTVEDGQLLLMTGPDDDRKHDDDDEDEDG